MTGRPLPWVCVAALAAVALSSPVRAVLDDVTQSNVEPSTGVIAGRVVDADTGAPIAGASIAIVMLAPPLVLPSDADAETRKAAADARRRAISTNGDGRFVVRGLPTGMFAVRATGTDMGYLSGVPGWQRHR